MICFILFAGIIGIILLGKQWLKDTRIPALLLRNLNGECLISKYHGPVHIRPFYLIVGPFHNKF